MNSKKQQEIFKSKHNSFYIVFREIKDGFEDTNEKIKGINNELDRKANSNELLKSN